MSIEIFDRDLLRQRRRRRAPSAEHYDFLFRRAEEDILDRLDTILREFPVALKIGALGGNGLIQHPKAGTVICLDDCDAYLLMKEGPSVLGDPEKLPFKEDSLDLVIAPLSLLFINDLPGTLLQICQSMRPDGLFMGVFAGGQTLYELRECFSQAEEEYDGGVSPRVAPFLDVRDGGALLQRAGFALPVADSETVTVSYETPFDLMNDLRGMGGTNVLISRRKKPLKRSTLMRMCEIYCERFTGDDGRIVASFEFVTLTGWKPADNQQKPLRPGSAKVRLSDALGVTEYSTGEKVEDSS